MLMYGNSTMFIETDFYIINDLDYIDSSEYQRKNLVKLKMQIREYGYILKEEKLDRISYDLYNIIQKHIDLKNVDLFISIGNGGKFIAKSLLKYLPTLNIAYVKFSRNWMNNGVEKFNFDFSNLEIVGKKVIILDDVLATGTSIKKAIEQLNNRNCNVVGCLVGITNEEYFKIEQQYPLYVARCIFKAKKMKDRQEPLWYPAIYSARHIFNFENGLEDFPQIFSNKYFNGKMSVINILKKIGHK